MTDESIENNIDVQKRRGRKPKSNEPKDEQVKKKRGRKKKYEIENFEKINNRNEVNNFDHNVAYSSDEETPSVCIIEDNKSIKTVSFGNLDITVSKAVNNNEVPDYKNYIQKSQIVENEWDTESDSELGEDEVEQEPEIEKVYNENKKYIPANAVTNNEESVKRIRIVTTVKNQLNFDQWPEKTDIHCWWCCHKFDTCPCTLPSKYDSLRKRFTFTGIFCSWNCVKAYNFSINDHLKYQRSELITLLIQQMYGITKAINVKAAPPRQCLKMFGGYLDIHDFRNNSFGVELYKMNLLNYNYIYPEVTELSNIKSKQQVKQNLRIKRS
jgi:hypothetical protein